MSIVNEEFGIKKAINGTVHGNGITFLHGNEVSGFNSTSWITLSEKFFPNNYSWEMVFHIKMDNFEDESSIFNCGDLGWQNIGLFIKSTGLLRLNGYVNNTSTKLFEIDGTTELEVGVEYWVKVTYNPNSGYAIYLSTDGVDYVEDGTSSVTTPISMQGYNLVLGADFSNNNVYYGAYFRGSIYLKDSYIDINDIRWWNGLKDKVALNVKTIGSVSFDNNFEATNFSTSNYCETPVTIPFHSADSWEICTYLYLAQDNGLRGCISTPVRFSGINLYYNNTRNALCLELSSNGTSFNIGSINPTTAKVGEFWVKIAFTGTKYQLYFSDNSIDWELQGEISSTDKIYKDNTFVFGTDDQKAGTSAKNLYIDFNDTYINVNGERFWEGTKSTLRKLKEIYIKRPLSKTYRFSAGSNLTEWEVPKGVTQLKVDCVASRGNTGTGGGGSGGRVQCKLNVTAGQKLYFTVGEVPASPIVVTYNASDIRIGGTEYSDRILVAGGGGSGGYSGSTVRGGDGGGLIGAAGQEGAYSYAGQGGTQEAGGTGGTNHVGGSQWNSPGGNGQFGLGGTSDNHSYHSQLGGIGGSGWYGGGGGAGVHTSNINSCSGGGGGSSYANEEYCEDIVHTQGYNTENGYIDMEILDDIELEKPKEVLMVKSGNKVFYLKKLELIGSTGGTVTGTNIWNGGYGNRTATSASGTITYPDEKPAGYYDVTYSYHRQANAGARLRLTFTYTDGTTEVVYDKNNFSGTPYDATTFVTDRIKVSKPWKSYVAYAESNRTSTQYCYSGIDSINTLEIKEYIK